MIDLDGLQADLASVPLPITLGVTLHTPHTDAAIARVANAAPELLRVARALERLGQARATCRRWRDVVTRPTQRIDDEDELLEAERAVHAIADGLARGTEERRGT